jgi:hypothetical protein
MHKFTNSLTELNQLFLLTTHQHQSTISQQGIGFLPTNNGNYFFKIGARKRIVIHCF